MTDSAPPIETLLELETRHDDLLRQLDDLNQEVERVLKDCQGGHAEPVDAVAVE